MNPGTLGFMSEHDRTRVLAGLGIKAYGEEIDEPSARR